MDGHRWHWGWEWNFFRAGNTGCSLVAAASLVHSSTALHLHSHTRLFFFSLNVMWRLEELYITYSNKGELFIIDFYVFNIFTLKVDRFLFIFVFNFSSSFVLLFFCFCMSLETLSFCWECLLFMFCQIDLQHVCAFACFFFLNYSALCCQDHKKTGKQF